MRIKCPHCKGKGFSELNSALNMTCGWCMGQGELDLEIVPTKPQTEQEYLQTCTTEQLAEWIAKIVDCDCCPVKRKFCDDNPCKIRFVEWLKQPHHEKE